MGHKNKPSLTQQVDHVLQGMLSPGRSKHADKRAGLTGGRIYSYSTYHSYTKHAYAFVKWAIRAHGCKTLEDCRPFAAEWIRRDDTRSAYTENLERAALAKLYQCKGEDICPTRQRLRADIKRSRGSAKRDAHFSEARNADLVAFCRVTGLRRSELQALRGSDLVQDAAGGLFVRVRSGKGGRPRNAPVIGDTGLVARLCAAAGDGKVFPSVHSAADIHGYRAQYATAIYDMYARDLEACKASGDVYWCRKDRRGTWFDKRAMLAASRALGHNRISVVGEHYIIRQ